ncbi:MAG: Asp-tRNA(Asn)/Glu-tRNA(Gln) amidotransferase subunit GatA, partial [Ardenticatenia bacterium]|nr:Asp-tRNA(Asn)/Glu-tRNA(Gln) amidotransferase subunit GatA [Ardenticatenia bacterium]
MNANTDLCFLTTHEALAWLRRGEVSSVALTQAVLDQILSVDNPVRAYISILPEEALAQPEAADQRRAEGQNPPFSG